MHACPYFAAAVAMDGNPKWTNKRCGACPACTEHSRDVQREYRKANGPIGGEFWGLLDDSGSSSIAAAPSAAASAGVGSASTGVGSASAANAALLVEEFAVIDLTHLPETIVITDD